MSMLVLKNSSIRQRLTYIIMSISCISVLLTTLAISIMGFFTLREGIINELSVSAAVVGDRNTAALAFNDPHQAEMNLNVFSVKQTILEACLYDEKDALFARYIQKGYEESGIVCPQDVTEGVKITQSRIHLMKPIMKMDDKIGSIYIESTLDEVNAYLQKQVAIALTVVMAVLIISYLLAISLQKAISQPILSLADTARQVSIHKDYSIRADIQEDRDQEYNNELVILTSAFNDMLTEIGQRDKQLKKQNTELEKARDAAEAANRAKSQFLANISHELRTPLNAIIGFSSILMNQLFGPLGDQKYIEYSKDINDSGAHLLDIINDILDLSKAEAGKLTLNYEEVHVPKSVNKCVSILSDRIEKGKITLIKDIPKVLPPLVADRLRFIQIVLNILSNAVKFTPEGGIVHLSVTSHEVEYVPASVTITIQDTGIGMSVEDQAKAFQSFGQVDSGLNRKYEGTGLGLPLTKKLVELHHGHITLQSEVGKGTTVTIIFPVLPPPDVEYSTAE